MSFVLGRRVVALAAALLAVAALLVVTGEGPAGASTHGRVGPVRYAARPLSCTYSGRTLTKVTATPPRVGMNLALARKGQTWQWIGAQVVLQGLVGSTWRKAAEHPGPRQTAVSVLVHPRKMVPFKHPRLFTFGQSDLSSRFSAFRVEVIVRWYAPSRGSRVTGTATRVLTSCDRVLPTPPVPPHVVKIDAGSAFACALMSDQSVRCWGAGSLGRLGDGKATNSTTPVTPTGLTSGVKAIAVGHQSACAITSAAALDCWGNNANGEIGDGTKTQRNTPVAVKGMTSGVSAVFLDYHTPCAMVSGQFRCWGYDTVGQAGDGAKTNVVSPKTISGVGTVMSASAGNDQGCSVSTLGGLYCWGDNNYMQLGISPADSTIRTKQTMSNAALKGTSALASGGAHVCAIVANGALKCWGANTQGQLGNSGANSSANSATPVSVTGLTSGVTSVSSMGNSVCAVKAGNVYCWGSNAYGQLGTGDVTTYNHPQLVSGPTNAVGVALGDRSAYAWDANGHVWAWGDNAYGDLATGDTTNHDTAVQVTIR